jgi:hypothetical protein
MTKRTTALVDIDASGLSLVPGRGGFPHVDQNDGLTA